jgi:polysaccharide pyruvyl transferase WcaK-like protein
MISHLRSTARAIFVRESESHAYLTQQGLHRNLFLMSDPAFVMEPVACDGDGEGVRVPADAIGLSLSPLMGRFARHADRGGWEHCCIDIVSGLSRKLGRPVVLVPHDTRALSDDYEFLLRVQSASRKAEEVFLLSPQLSAPELKWLISKMLCVVAARTHVAIAGLSCCIPTLTLSYSVKSVGINKELFGDCRYLLPARSVTAETVIDKVREILRDRTLIQEALGVSVPRARRRAIEAGDILRHVLQETG